MGRLLGLEGIKLRLRGGRRALVETAEAGSALLGGMAETAEWLSGGSRRLRCDDALATSTSGVCINVQSAPSVRTLRQSRLLGLDLSSGGWIKLVSIP